MDLHQAARHLKIPGEKLQGLIGRAREAATASYSPYSHFRVGAALLCPDGTIISGCNVENASYGLALCAERCAISKAVSEGHRQFSAIAVTTLDLKEELIGPCGACRQFIIEFNPQMLVLSANQKGDRVQIMTADELLPQSFGPHTLVAAASTREH